ncbi:MAG TPA: FAD-dependent oxidoreductase, partial [Bryobacteraceae bacterium]|nr:FAD-dependent oxidoreductase [Bryobacteraceae bacterium]
INTHPKWRVLRGGSHRYLAPLTAPYKDRIHLGARIASIARSEGQVSIHFSNRPALTFDQVVLACHGDQVLPLLESPADAERDIFRNFTTSRNEACLHTDESLLPRRPSAQASWNYNLGLNGRNAATLTYDMNRLQSLDVVERYCVTLNGGAAIDPAKRLARIVYHHPLYTHQAIAAQARWSKVSGVNRTHYCGAYWFYGFHEDGLNSALRVARSLEVDC